MTAQEKSFSRTALEAVALAETLNNPAATISPRLYHMILVKSALLVQAIKDSTLIAEEVQKLKALSLEPTAESHHTILANIQHKQESRKIIANLIKSHSNDLEKLLAQALTIPELATNIDKK